MNINMNNGNGNLSDLLGSYVTVRSRKSRRVFSGYLLEIDGKFQVKLGTKYFDVTESHVVEVVEIP